jgi:hypothetical protein
MTAAEDSVLGLALQSVANTIQSTDADFKYLLFREGSFGPQNIVLPVDPEVGGGAMPRGMAKVGTTSGGALDLIPRPDTLGLLLYGLTGECTTTTNYYSDVLLSTQSCDGSTVDTSGLTQPTVPTKIYLTPSAAITGNIIITGTDSADDPLSDTINNLAAAGLSTETFKTVTSIEVPTDVGKTVDAGWPDGTYNHVFALENSDNYSAPYYTARQLLSIGKDNDFGETFLDVRPSMLSLNWKAPGFVRGMAQFVGRNATPNVDPATWSYGDQIDAGPQFLTSPGDSIAIGGTDFDVLSGTLAMASSIPMDEQFKVGSYFPSGVDIVSRSFGVQFAVKLPDEGLYHKMAYDKDAGNAWLANIYSEGRLTMNFKTGDYANTNPSGTGAAANRNYSVAVAANGQTGADSNILWSMAPITLRAQRQVVAAISGMFIADPRGNASYDPITITLVNQTASYAAS